MVGLIFITTSIIYSLAIQFNGFHVDGEPMIQDWHGALYFSVVTLTTVGYGDISPKTPFARMVIILIIATSFILVPLEVARLAEAYTRIPKYRKGYKMAGKALHVILVSSSTDKDNCSGFEEYGLKRILEDIIHSDHGPKSKNIWVVIMSPALPSERVQLLLNSPKFKRQTMYYRGNVQNPQDLAAIKAEFADCIILMIDKQKEKRLGIQARREQVMLSTMALMRYMSRTPRIPEYLLRKVCALQRATGREEKTKIIVVAHGSQDRKVLEECGVTAVLCRDELKLGMMAQSTICPSFLCFAANCLNSSSQSSNKEYRNFLISGNSSKENVSIGSGGARWLQDYIAGSAYEVYSFKIPLKQFDIFDGVLFIEAAKFVYNFTNGKILFLGCMCGGDDSGFDLKELNPESSEKEIEYFPKMKEIHENLGRRAVVMPTNMIFKAQKGKIVEATVFMLGKSWHSINNELNKMFELSKESIASEWDIINEFDSQFSKVDREVALYNAKTNVKQKIFNAREKNLEYLDPKLLHYREAFSSSQPFLQDTSRCLNKLVEIDNQVKHYKSSSQDLSNDYFKLLAEANSCMDKVLKAHVPKMPETLINHVVIIIENHAEIDQYIISLRNIRPDIQIVIISRRKEMYHELLERLDELKDSNEYNTQNINLDEVYLASGSCRSFTVLEHAQVEKAKAVVLLSSFNIEGDTATLLTSFALEQYLIATNSKPQLLIELQQEKNIYFLRQKASLSAGIYDGPNIFAEKHFSDGHKTAKGVRRRSIVNPMNIGVSHKKRSENDYELYKFNPNLSSDACFSDKNVHNWPSFASGKVWIESVMDSLCVQLYYNEGMLSFWEKLCPIRRSMVSESSISSSFDLSRLKQTIKPPDEDGIFKRGGCVHQMRLNQSDFDGELYHDLVWYLLARGCMPLGLYRPEKHKGASLQYTHINPSPDEPLVFGFMSEGEASEDNLEQGYSRPVSTSAASLPCDTVLYIRSSEYFQF
eukprot:CAMPEP_0171460360 /NCGR_PEP_ID=MMETSP0945-20130129/5264_1 /TAXON_ID=109269 /ORGANISM="Vaucheria litorea, Strain CCMP2940" /LENGTH=986 /DNA_ID=CAMNT_0011986541 /DNA_START=720 /DNA_END=3680 /DNA_ORIENTATION=-